MRLVRLDAVRFGPLVGRTFDLDPRCSVLLGHNEAGKSSFLSAVETVLYGFDPARREAHPLVRFPARAGAQGDLELVAELLLDSGERAAVERVLQERGKLRRGEPGHPFEGARGSNRDLPEVGGVPRSLFRSVYALSAEELVALDDDVRQHVDELLLGERAVPGLRPSYRVRRELDEEERRLWRPDRVGKPRSRELERGIAEQRRAVADARAAERALREARDEREVLRGQLEELREQRRRLDTERADAELLARLAAVRRDLRATEGVDLSGLGDAPLEDPAELARTVAEFEGEVAAPRARLTRPALALDAARVRVLAAAARIDAQREGRSGQAAAVRALAETDAELARLERELGAELERVGARPGASPAEPPLDALRAVQGQWSAALERGRTTPEPRALPPWIPVLAVAGGAVVAAAAVGLVPPILALLGAGLFALAFAAVVARTRAGGATSEPPGPPPDLERLLAGWSVDPALRASPSGLQRLVERFEAVAERRRRAGEARGRRATLEASIDAWERAGQELARELGIEAEGPADAVLTRLSGALERAREAQAAERTDAAERADAAARVEALEPQLLRRRERLGRLLAILEQNAPGAPDASARHALLRERIDARRAAEHRASELRADARFERLAADPRADLPDEEAPWSDEACAARVSELERLDGAIDRANTRWGELSQLLRDAPASAAARAQEDLAELEDELAAVLRARDRTALLARLLGEADRRYRDAHQPDVLRHASRYLRAITDGRYTRLDYPDPAEGELAGLQVAGGALAEPVPVEPPLSRGTRDQIYLSLRLGLLDHLDDGRERLPLVLDEALVHWDEGRRAQVYRVLAEVAERRQVLLLTCHEHLAAEAVAALDARRIDLSTPEASGDRPRAVL